MDVILAPPPPARTSAGGPYPGPPLALGLTDDRSDDRSADRSADRAPRPIRRPEPTAAYRG
ncbi:hypothetical protein AMK27_03170 [Streptomyces sp. CB02009]|nr:hypothetical protein AMK27_03170 [Streptomyces sp. CB02009]